MNLYEVAIVVSLFFCLLSVVAVIGFYLLLLATREE